uniref:Uncharacterized protein n=1 Tax=Anguilla anguilla TaxID=7936 RepID=A0A0E9S787_ANGAN
MYKKGAQPSARGQFLKSHAVHVSSALQKK